MEAEDKPQKDERLTDVSISSELKTAFLDYAMSVIVSRALPDVRDGLKPVHRRILYAMHDMSMHYNKPFKKCARIVGEVLGKYHPHGDSAVYESLVRMAQEWSLRIPLINGQGNFGSIDGDSAAAMRYTEARLQKIAGDLLSDIEKETVEFRPNFDGSLEEPTVLPSKVPNLLVNGSSGIAVGMATSIPPHNLIEVSKAIIASIDNPEIEISELLDYVKGPDFPTGGTIVGRSGILQAYMTGRGKVKTRAKIVYEETKSKNKLIVNEIPYMVNKSNLLQEIANAVKNKVIEGISGLRDESDREGMRIVIELKRDAIQEIVVNQLYKHTRLQTISGITLLALVDYVPKVLNLKEIITHFIDFRIEIITNRTKFELKKAEERSHILEGLIIALNDIENIIEKIRKSEDGNAARDRLMEDYSLSDLQAKAILDMKLQKLASLEQEKIKTEYNGLQEQIKDFNSILSNKERIFEIIRNEQSEIVNSYGEDRRTDFIDDEEDYEIEDLIEPEDMVVTISHSGYIKRIPMDTYKQQRRGGKGIIAQETKEDDIIEHIFVANTHSYLLIFTDKGKIYWKKVYKVPEAGRYSKGKAIVNLINLDKDENVSAVVPMKEFKEGNYLIFATKNGTVKKTSVMEYSRPRQGGIWAINLEEGNDVIGVVHTDGNKELIIATRLGRAARFNERDVRSVSRNSKGVRGIRLRTGDEVIGMVVAETDRTLLTITENGYGKRTNIDEYRLIQRGGKGVINIKVDERNGGVVAIKSVIDEDGLMFISKNGQVIRTSAKFISVIGRNTKGVRLMRMNQDDLVVDAARIINDEDEDEGLENESDNSDDKTDLEVSQSENNLDEEKLEDKNLDEEDLEDSNSESEKETSEEYQEEEKLEEVEESTSENEEETSNSIDLEPIKENNELVNSNLSNLDDEEKTSIVNEDLNNNIEKEKNSKDDVLEYEVDDSISIEYNLEMDGTD
ncbi:DNA gyrase subunit A [archaeon]|jgi:DNA gyrase subunit A|nr:DNA gyrase subunit A [archaeon]MBT4352821.1 DNA gyrase subunit A [archaeon]MBT4647037.1 DNA gyrase subunit A [archaeon]MBT6820946.1 DNA gyrase subunit A [archaeon]MBT7392138.1 DNA gyrase subunit A [archaeon]